MFLLINDVKINCPKLPSVFFLKFKRKTFTKNNIYNCGKHEKMAALDAMYSK